MKTSVPYALTRDELLLDLYHAYKDARRHKRSKDYQQRFEMNLERELLALRDELWTRTYNPRSSTCFMVHDPKMREVFAAQFRDRVVHHLLYNYVHVLFERTFIADTYSCIVGRGTHYGVKRIRHHIASVSNNWKSECWILKIDISGYFMHIRRDLLLQVCSGLLLDFQDRKSDVPGKTWGEKIDYPFVLWLLEKIVMIDPTINCNRISPIAEWDKLPASKSLFCVEPGRGLPIGNLTSQLFSNVYMNVFDQFVKRQLGCKHYGRYVDDAYFVAADRATLRKWVPQIDAFLRDKLDLTLSREKVQMFNAKHGVQFIGAYIRPHRIYTSNSTLKRMRRKIHELDYINPRHLQAQVNSRLGTLSHYASFRLRRKMFGCHPELIRLGEFDKKFVKFTPYALKDLKKDKKKGRSF